MCRGDPLSLGSCPSELLCMPCAMLERSLWSLCPSLYSQEPNSFATSSCPRAQHHLYWQSLSLATAFNLCHYLLAGMNCVDLQKANASLDVRAFDHLHIHDLKLINISGQRSKRISATVPSKDHTSSNHGKTVNVAKCSKRMSEAKWIRIM